MTKDLVVSITQRRNKVRTQPICLVVCLLLAYKGGQSNRAVAQIVESAQTSESTVVDRGPFWRTWNVTTREVDPITSAVTTRTGQYTELGAGLHYHDGNDWVESEALIELSPTGGAEAVRGPHKAFLPPTLAIPIELIMPSGQMFVLQPLGLYYFDAASGKTAQVAAVDPGVNGLLLPPNRVVYPKAFGDVGDLMYVYGVNGFDQSVILVAAVPPPEEFGLPSASTRLEVWTAFDGPPPEEQRPILLSSEPTLWRRQQMVEPDLVDHMLVFEDCWFPVGAAFVLDDSKFPEPGEPAQVTVVDPSDPGNLLVAKNLVQIDNRTVLVESVGYPDLSRKLLAEAGLGQGAGRAKSGSLFAKISPRRALPLERPRPRPDRKIELASVLYNPSGLLLDYTILSGSASSYTFSNAWTYVISNNFSVGPGTATFQQNSVIKSATNAYLLTYGPVSFPASGTPVTFTSADDNAYGQTISGSTSMPNYAPKPALWMYYYAGDTTIEYARFRWAQRAVQYDQNPGIHQGPKLRYSTFMNCNVGVYLNLRDDTLSLVGDTGCNLVTAIQVQTGSYSGSITTDCGVALVSRVNSPAQDTASGDPNKNSQSECSFVVVNTNRVVAGFFETHFSQYALGQLSGSFSSIPPPRSTGLAVSTDGGASFTDNGSVPPAIPSNPTQGDVGDPVMVRDAINGNGTNGPLFLLTNPARVGTYQGFRLWKSSDNGQNFSLVNTNVPGGVSGVDKPMLAINNFAGLSNSTNLYAAGTAGGVFIARSANAGATWTGVTNFGIGHGADIAIHTNGTVYVFYLASRFSGGVYTNWLQYHWLRLGQTVWQGPGTLSMHVGRTNFYSTNGNASGNLKRSNSAATDDYFVSNGFPRVAVNPANGRIYVVYADLPFAGSSTDRGDIFIQEGVADATGALTWSGEIKVNNDRTATDQWNPSIAINPAGSRLFVGYCSRQGDPSNNALVKAYGAKANIAGGLVGATFDVFPISSVAFTNLFAGTTNSTPSNRPWLFDPVWPQTDVSLDASAKVVDTGSPSMVVVTGNTYAHFTADDYTWSAADSSFFYFVWRDCSDVCMNSWKGTNYVRADPNIRLGKVNP